MHLHRLADRRAVVDEGEAPVAGARIVPARLVGVVRQLDERRVLAQRHRVRRRRDARHRAGEQTAAASAAARASTFANRRRTLRRPAAAAAPAGRFVDEGERHVDLGVLRKAFGVREVERAARAIDAVGARPERAAGVRHVAEQEIGCIDQQAAVALAGDREAPQDRFRERVLHRFALGGIRAARPKRLIRLHEQHPRPDALEIDDASAAAGAAIEPNVVRSEARRQAGRIEELGVEPRNLDEQRSAALVPVQRKVAVDLLHACRAGVDRRDRSGARLP